MRICLVYDCHYPHTIGGGEHLYAQLARRLVADGHDVTYLTLRQWPRGQSPRTPYRVRVAGPRMRLYTRGGRRRVLPPLVFGAGVLLHLLRHGRAYDVVHTASFPYFSLLAAGLARRRARYRVVVDWLEVWSRDYWRGYLGRLGGAVGYAVQALCARIPQRAFSFSRLHAERLRAIGGPADVVVLGGQLWNPPPAGRPLPAAPRVVFAGRHIPEKRVPAIVPAVAAARRQVPDLTAVLLGDGPERDEVLRAIAVAGTNGAIQAPGFVDAARLAAALADALCFVLPSSREGYGLAVLEAAARGVPAVLVAGEGNAAVERLVPGENGVLARSAAPSDLRDAILEVHARGHALRESTAAWYAAHRSELSVEASLERVSAAYAG